MGKLSKRFNIFKSIYKELKLKESDKVNEITKEDMEKFKNQVDESMKKDYSFISCREECLNDIELLKDAQVNWSLFHNMYFAALPEKNEALINESKRSREALITKPQLSNVLLSNGFDLGGIVNSPVFSNMITAILPSVQKAFDGKDISQLNLNEMMQGIMEKDSQKAGFDIEEVIDKIKNIE